MFLMLCYLLIIYGIPVNLPCVKSYQSATELLVGNEIKCFSDVCKPQEQ